MKSLRLNRESENMDDIDSLVDTICHRFSNFSSKNIRGSIYFSTTRNARTKQLSHSIEIYEDETDQEVYKILKDKFKDILIENPKIIKVKN